MRLVTEGAAGSGAAGRGGETRAVMEGEGAVMEELQAAQRGKEGAATAVPLAHAWTPGPVLESFTVATLMRANVHLGHSTRAVHRHMRPYLLGERNGVHVIDLEHTQAALRRAVNVVREVAARGGIILFVGTRPELADLMVTSAGRCAQYHVIHKWVPGTLTNMSETVGRSRRTEAIGSSGGRSTAGDDAVDGDWGRSGSGSGSSDDYAGGRDEDSPSDGALIAQALQATATRPDLLLLFDPLLNDIALREAERCHVPTIGLADTNSDPRRLTYPIPANDDSVLSVAYIASILANAALEGMLAAANAAASASAAAAAVGSSSSAAPPPSGRR